MTFAPGTSLGHFEIVGAINAGGMGEVYRAIDSKLGRDVALEVLPAPDVSVSGKVRARRSAGALRA